MTALQKLVPASERTAFNTEVLGMTEAHAAGYVPEELLTKVRTEEGIGRGVARVYVAIDPASHRRSLMGLAAVCFGASGEYVLLGVASIQCSAAAAGAGPAADQDVPRPAPRRGRAGDGDHHAHHRVQRFGDLQREPDRGVPEGFPPVHNAFNKKEVHTRGVPGTGVEFCPLTPGPLPDWRSAERGRFHNAQQQDLEPDKPVRLAAQGRGAKEPGAVHGVREHLQPTRSSGYAGGSA